MEQELGHSLFIRRKGYRNAQLTDQGAEFYRIAWNKDFKSWHSENFDETIPPLVILEHAALASYFMTENPGLSALIPQPYGFKKWSLHLRT